MIQHSDIFVFLVIQLLSLLLKEIKKKTKISFLFIKIVFWTFCGYAVCLWKISVNFPMITDFKNINSAIDLSLPILFSTYAIECEWIVFDVKYSIILFYTLVSFIFYFFCSVFLDFSPYIYVLLLSNNNNREGNSKNITIIKALILFSFDVFNYSFLNVYYILTTYFGATFLGILIAIVVNKWTYRILTDGKYKKSILFIITVMFYFISKDYLLIDINYYWFCLTFSYFSEIFGDNYILKEENNLSKNQFYFITQSLKNYLIFLIAINFGIRIFNNIEKAITHLISCFLLFLIYQIFINIFERSCAIIFRMNSIRSLNYFLKFNDSLNFYPNILMIVYCSAHCKLFYDETVYILGINYLFFEFRRMKNIITQRRNANLGIYERFKIESYHKLTKKLDKILKKEKETSLERICDWEMVREMYSEFFESKTKSKGKKIFEEKVVELEEMSIISQPLNKNFQKSSEMISEIRLKLILFIQHETNKLHGLGKLTRKTSNLIIEVCEYEKEKSQDPLKVWTKCHNRFKADNVLKISEALKEFYFLGKFARRYIQQKLFYSYEMMQAFLSILEKAKSEMNYQEIELNMKSKILNELTDELDSVRSQRYLLSQNFSEHIKGINTIKVMISVHSKVKKSLQNEFSKYGINSEEEISDLQTLDRKLFCFINKIQENPTPNFFSFVLEYPLFSTLSSSDLKLLLSSMEEISFEKGQCIWVEGKKLTLCYMIKGGLAQEYINGKEIMHSIGDFIGLHSLFTKENAAVSNVFSEEKLFCITFPLHLIRSLMIQNKEFKDNLIKLQAPVLVYFYQKKCQTLSQMDFSKLSNLFVNGEVFEMSKNLTMNFPKGGFVLTGNLETLIRKDEFLKKSKYYYEFGSEIPASEDALFAENHATIVKF